MLLKVFWFCVSFYWQTDCLFHRLLLSSCDYCHFFQKNAYMINTDWKIMFFWFFRTLTVFITQPLFKNTLKSNITQYIRGWSFSTSYRDNIKTDFKPNEWHRMPCIKSKLEKNMKNPPSDVRYVFGKFQYGIADKIA